MVGLLALVIVGCMVILGSRYVQDTDSSDSAVDRLGSVLSVGDAADEQQQRELAMRQARQFVLRVFTYGPDDLDENDQLSGYVSGVEELITPKFAVDFTEQSDLAVQTVVQGRVGRTAEVTLIGVNELSSDQATVMVAGSFTTSYPSSADDGERETTPPVPLRLDVSLVKSDGEWLVDDFEPVTGEIDSQGAGTTPAPTPSAPAAPTAPTDPSPGQGQQGQGQQGQGQQGQGQQGQGQQGQGQQGQGQQGQGQQQGGRG